MISDKFGQMRYIVVRH